MARGNQKIADSRAQTAKMRSVEQFYDDLADSYHLIFEDWDRAIARHARTLDKLIKSKLGNQSLKIHDCACGIGTQSIGLATLGHDVSGSDLSRAAVERAHIEAARRGCTVEFRVSNMTTLAEYPSGRLDVLGAFDNALPHLAVDELKAATKSFQRLLRPGGFFVASIRDYDDLIHTRPAFQGPSFFGSVGTRRIVHQLWEWTGADAYNAHQYISLERERRWEVLHFATRYRCLLRAELTQVLLDTGFADVEWLMPINTGFFQPILIGRRS